MNRETFRNTFKLLAETHMKDAMLKARENPAIVVTKEGRLRSSQKALEVLQNALKSGKIISAGVRQFKRGQMPDFETPMQDHNFMVHQGVLYHIHPKTNVASEVAHMSASDTGHIVTVLRGKGNRAGKTIHIHGGNSGEDFIEHETDNFPYRVSLTAGTKKITGLPDLSEGRMTATYHDHLLYMLEQKLFKKPNPTKAIATGLAAAIVGLGAGSLMGKANSFITKTPAKTSATQPQAPVGSGQMRAKTVKRTPHEIEVAGHFIRQSENFSPKAYNLGDGKITIGYGTTQYANGKPVKMGDTITREQAEAEHDHYINRTIIPQMEKQKWWNGLGSHQRAAVISFSYNHGAYWHTKPEYKPMIDALSNPSNFRGVQTAWYQFAHSKKNPSLDKGLRNRAAAELDVFSGAWKPPERKKN